jgi:TPR repeat protein
MQAATAEAYRTLDLEPGADLGSVRHAYRVLVKVWHPDRFANDPKMQAASDEKLKHINASYKAIVAYLASGSEENGAPRSDYGPMPRPRHTLSSSELYKSGLKCFHAGDRTSAEELFLQAAERGDAKAQYAYGYLIYEEGYLPLEADKYFAKVLRWWTRAADQGHTEAQFMVATFHQLGLGTAFNETEALKWLKLAAAKGHQGAHRWFRSIILRKLHTVPLVKLVLEPPAAPTWGS